MFDNRKIYASELENDAKKIVEKCIHNKVPVFITFAIVDDNNKTEYQSFVADPDVMDLTIHDDRIKKHINVMNGFETVLPLKEESFDEIDF